MAWSSLSRTVALVVVALVATTLGGCRSSADLEVQKLQARAAYEQAIKHLSERRVSLGLTSLNEAVTIDPTNPIYRNALGVIRLELKQPKEAQAEFAKAIELDPGYAEAHHNLGLAHAEQRRYEEAIVAYRKALALPTYPSPELAYHNMGNAYLGLHRLGEAEEAYRAALRLEHRRVETHYNLGALLAMTGRKAEARQEFQAVREIDPSSPFAELAGEALKRLDPGG
jgi:Tfp pilus assembly protein PilF